MHLYPLDTAPFSGLGQGHRHDLLRHAGCLPQLVLPEILCREERTHIPLMTFRRKKSKFEEKCHYYDLKTTDPIKYILNTKKTSIVFVCLSKCKSSLLSNSGKIKYKQKYLDGNYVQPPIMHKLSLWWHSGKSKYKQTCIDWFWNSITISFIWQVPVVCFKMKKATQKTF